MAFYFRAEERLIRYLMEDYSRRGMSFLQVGLHSPINPDFFWDSGFDVTALDDNPNTIEKALILYGPRISYQIGQLNYLPFDNDSFDYIFFSSYIRDDYKTELSENQFLLKKQMLTTDFNQSFYGHHGILNELCRVARQGVIILTKNAFSFNKLTYQGAFVSPFTLWKQAKKYCPFGKVSLSSAGFLPRFAPNSLSCINNAVSMLPFGAIVGINIQFNVPTTTGLGILIRNKDACLLE